MSAAAMGSGGAAGSAGLIVGSDSFKDGDYLASEFSCEGRDHSPDIHWSFKDGAKSFALICEDPDAPGGTFIHWVVYNIPASYSRLAKGFPGSGAPDGIMQGVNDFGEYGYKGPCPPRGRPHHYIFTLYALDTVVSGKGLSAAELKKAIKGHVLASGSVTGLFKR